MENESTFVAPEGTTVSAGQHTVNAVPILYPTRLSAVTVRYPTNKSVNSPVFTQLLGGNRERESKKDKDKDRVSPKAEDGLSVSSSEDPDDASPDVSTAPGPENVKTSPMVGHDIPNNIFSHTPAGKKKAAARPKHNMRTTSSTFITRLQNADNLHRNLQSKQGETTFLFYNSAKSFIWTEAGTKAKETLARIHFSAHPTCHDVNLATVCPERIDVIIGFNTGDLLWFDPMSSRYGRLNKQGRICTSPCTAVRWVPDSPNLFLVSHANGTIVVYDKEREDGAFVAQEPGAPSGSTPGSPVEGVASSSSIGEWDPLDSIYVTMPPWHPVTVGGAMAGGGKQDKDKTAKNPVSHWKVSRKRIVDFVFSPDAKFVAAISEDGCLRVIDTIAEQLIDCYASYFGALSCVAWSPDGRFIITGGQDDLVTIISPWEQRVIARCQGHSSFVSALAFDDIRCDGRTYRFGSVGEDNKLILWDFSSGALHRPKLHASHQQRISMTSSLSLALRRRGESTLFLSPNGAEAMPRYHPAPSRNEVAVVQPVLVKHIGADMLTDIMFMSRGILTASRTGHIKLWIRPLVVKPRHLRSQSTYRRDSWVDVAA
ncbi:WD40-repeat-containing domain protein [Fomitopsis serialis]|uniref:WD40-repeat-containing domain protein n=1 Tax=Fomitopsis serialis TaxID=139415 RepID=UPI002008A99A|nr:WD40-repeat-containing domain protein [Neoantrodia serialis]KAH9930755.1 WD40-repeat-containing domain protein [Neoantrodia serialis]